MKDVKCPNCCAVYPAADVKCPYCGYINPDGAEKKYLNDLEARRNDLDKVDDTARDGYLNEMKKSSGMALKIVLITAIIVAVLAGIWVAAENGLFNRGRDDYAEELIWEHSHFDKYDEMFANGNYEELIAAIAEDSETHDVWNWEHYDEFMDIADQLWGD